MSSHAVRLAATTVANDADESDGRAIVRSRRSNELFFAVVGPVGAGSSRTMGSLKRACEEQGYRCETIKASALIRKWAADTGRDVPTKATSLETVKSLQDLGDAMREKDAAAVARLALADIAERRAKLTNKEFEKGKPVEPGEEKVVYLIDSIRHPAEIMLFRRTYASAFALIGVVCEESERERRLLGKYLTVPQQQVPDNQDLIKQLIARDANDEGVPNGQHVVDAFYQADFFVDNTKADQNDTHGYLDEALTRLVSIISHDRLVRPTMDETAMHHAHSARVRSACLSRQVGAALVDHDGTVISTGTNEVPQAGGGVYGENLASMGGEDHRCAFRTQKYCSSNREQNRIIDELIDKLPELSSSEDRNSLRKRIRGTSIGQLIEFSRAVHAEMDALLSAAREGVSTIGTRLFVTTFPCHYCARHIVSAGVYEVQYIEPYPKSLALSLHKDAISVDETTWVSPRARGTEGAFRANGQQDASQVIAGKVLFRPFVGVAPRLYLRAFEKIRTLKNKETGDMSFEEPAWGDEWAPSTVAYPELEAALTRDL